MATIEVLLSHNRLVRPANVLMRAYLFKRLPCSSFAARQQSQPQAPEMGWLVTLPELGNFLQDTTK